MIAQIRSPSRACKHALPGSGCADITYIPIRKGFLYLVAIMDWCTRKVLAWRISNTLEADFCVEALNEAIHKFSALEIMKSDREPLFTSFAWTDRLKWVGSRISMPLAVCNANTCRCQTAKVDASTTSLLNAPGGH